MKKITLMVSFLAYSAFCNAQVVTTLAGSTAGSADGTGTAAQFNSPRGVTDAAGNVYVADTGNYRIRKITPTGVVSTFAGSTQGTADGTGTAAQFWNPLGVATDAAGNVYVADNGHDRIRKITPAGVVSTLALLTYDGPQGIAVDTAGNVYVSNSDQNEITKITPTGVVSTFAILNFNGKGLAIDTAGNLYSTDYDSIIHKITPTSVVTIFAGSTVGSADGIGTAAQFYSPWGVATDAAGNVYVADAGNDRIRKITPAGVVSTLAGSTDGSADGTGTAAQFLHPLGVDTDAAGNIYVADTGNNRIRKITMQPLGINDNFLESTTFMAYPNPCRDLLKIQSIGQEVYSYRLCDMTGKQILSGNYNDTAKSGINTSGLAKGVYLLSLTAEGKTQNIKVVKE